MPVKAAPAAPAAAPSAVGRAFGVAFTTDYELRGVSQSNHKPAVQGYFEVDYTATDWLKLYAGIWGSSLWTGFADAEFDITAGARFTWGNFGLDIGYIQYEYPGGGDQRCRQLWRSLCQAVIQVYRLADRRCVSANLASTTSTAKSRVSGAGIGWAMRVTTTSPATRSSLCRGTRCLTSRSRSILRSAANITALVSTSNLGAVRIHYWDVGLDFNYKAITLDLRYWDINIDTGQRHRFDPSAGNQCGVSGLPTSAVIASSQL